MNLRIALELMPDGHSNKPTLYNNLGSTLRTQFERLGIQDDIQTAIANHERAVLLTPDGHPNIPSFLHSLASSHRARFERLGGLDDLNSSISYHQKALDATPEGYPQRPYFHDSLGSCLTTRFERLGHVEDVYQAILHHQAAVELTPELHPAKPLRHRNLGFSFRIRFLQLGDVKDVDAAIAQHKQALELMPPEHPEMHAYLSSLGSSLKTRFDRLGIMDDLRQAISLQLRAVASVPEDHYDKPTWHNNLGNSLRTRFDKSGNVDDLDQAIAHHIQAVELTPDVYFNKSSWCSNLGSSYFRRFSQLRKMDDIHQAVFYHQQAMNLLPDGHSETVACILNLVSSLSNRLEDNDLIVAIHLCRSAVLLSHGSPQQRFEAAKRWCQCLYKLKSDLPSLFDAYETTIQLLPRLSWIGVSLSTRLHQLFLALRIGPEAASVAISMGRAEVAIQWLEESRSVIWHQIAQMRTPLEELAEAHPNLAGELMEKWRELDSQTNSSLNSEKRIQYALESDRLIEHIRSLPGFESFLLPVPFDKLRTISNGGPIIVLIASKYRCDAIILTSKSELHLVNLDRCEFKVLRSMEVLLRWAAKGGPLRQEDAERAFGPSKSESQPSEHKAFESILGYLWYNVVKPCLSCLAKVEAVGPNKLYESCF